MSAFLLLVQISIPGGEEWQASNTSVALTIPGSSTSSSDSSASSVSSQSSVNTSVTPEALNPSGDYRHHETRVQEMLLRMIRDGTLTRGRSSSSRRSIPVTHPSEGVPTTTTLPHFPNLFPSMGILQQLFQNPSFVSLPLFISDDSNNHTAAPALHTGSGSGTIDDWKSADDLDPDAYGWISSQASGEDGWLWNGFSQFFHLGTKYKNFEWILWLLVLILLLFTVRAGIRLQDDVVDLFVAKAKPRNDPLEKKEQK
jgi:hypothetical protein